MAHSIEIELDLRVVLPALVILREQADKLAATLGAPLNGSPMTSAAIADVNRLLDTFSPDFANTGRIVISTEVAPEIARACSLLRLHLRQNKLAQIPDDVLEAGTPPTGAETDAGTAYAFVGTLQEIVLQHFAHALTAGSFALRRPPSTGGFPRRLRAALGRVSPAPTAPSADAAHESKRAVVVLNDPVNSMSYVTFLFNRLLGLAEETAKARMQEVHLRKRSVVWEGTKEEAERRMRALRAWHLNVITELVDHRSGPTPLDKPSAS